MMNKFISALAIIIIFCQCSKKTVESVTSTATNKEWRKMAPQPAAARDIQLGAYTTFDLPNGLKVIVVENHKLPRVSYQISFNTDALIEGNKAGYTSFAGDLLSKGTSTRTKSQIDESIDYIGASMSTSAGGLFGSSLKKHTGKLLEIMTDVLYNPSFPKDEFEKIRKRTASNLSTSKTNPDAIAANIRTIVNYGEKHPYGEVETEETIKNITLDDCKSYISTYFKPNNAYLVIVGDITPEEAKSQSEKYFSAWKRGQVPSFKYENPQGPMGSQVRFGNKEGAVQSVINITYPIDMKPGSPDAIKSSLMNSILGGGIFSGRLMQNLREKKAFTYGARSSMSSDKLIGNFNAAASVRNEVTDSAVTEFIYEMSRMVKEPVSDNDIKLAKNSMAGNFGRSLEAPETIAGFALNTFRYNLPKDYYNNYLKNLDAVTITDVTEMAKKYISPENCNIVVVGNKDNVADKLKKFDSDGVIDFYDAFGKKLEDKKVEISSDITASGIIDDYIDAIGGLAKLKSVTSIHTSMKTTMMGQDATFETYQMTPDKFAMKVNMMGMTVQEQKYDGSKGLQAQMANKKVITEGKELDQMKKQAVFFDQMYYSGASYKLELKGVENVDGNNCYKILVTESDGDITTEFYDVKTNLLNRTIKSQKGQGGKDVSIITEFKDYKEIAGVMMPHKSVISGAMPVPIELDAVIIEINQAIAPEIFKID